MRYVLSPRVLRSAFRPSRLAETGRVDCALVVALCVLSDLVSLFVAGAKETRVLALKLTTREVWELRSEQFYFDAQISWHALCFGHGGVGCAMILWRVQ